MYSQYSHYLPNCTEHVSVSPRLNSRHRIRSRSPYNQTPSLTYASTYYANNDCEQQQQHNSSSIDHYLERLNRTYRSSLSPPQQQKPTNNNNNKNAYDLYNNDNFYIRKYGDFYMTGNAANDRGAYIGSSSNNNNNASSINNLCDLHGPTTTQSTTASRLSTKYDHSNSYCDKV